MNRTSNPSRLRFRAFQLALVLFMAAGCLRAADQLPSQPRTHGTRVPIPVEAIRVDDGDTIAIAWGQGQTEVVRILGIDAPETQHVEHDLPFDQPFGREAMAFARGVFATADQVELLRAATLDPYDRTLGYVFVNGKNYSVLILQARLAVETVSVFGDNGFPREAATCLKAAAEARPVPFESPHLFRRRMRDVAEQMRTEGRLPPKANERN